MNAKNPSPASASGERLQKVLAAAGVASRRECEQWILDGRIEVDREIVTELGVRVDPDTQEIRVDGTAIKIRRRAYYLLNKPPGVVSTNSDPEGRPRVIDLIKSEDRLFPVGRLDRSSEGLILVTNDGDLANKLAHPRFGIHKTYLATVQGRPTAEQLQQLRDGVYFSDGKAKVVSVEIKKKLRDQTILEIVLDEGRNREIRRMLARVGHKVYQLKRIAIGCIHLDDTPSGAYRPLTRREIEGLGRLVARGRGGQSRPASGRPKRSAKTGRPPGKKKGRSAAKTPRGKQRRSELTSTPNTGLVIGGDVAEPASEKPPQRPAGAKKKAVGKRRAAGKSGGRPAKSDGRPAGQKRDKQKRTPRKKRR